MEKSKEWLENLLSRKTEENVITKVLHVESKSATKKGDNYVGDVKKICLEVLLKSGKRRKKSFIVKQQPNTEYRKIILEKLGLFRREIMVYHDVLPIMEDIMREYGDYTEFMWGTCLHYTAFDELILNDLNDEGYTMSNRREALDLEHCQLVLRSLAKFHATSALIKHRGLICMEMFGKHMFEDSYFQELNKNFQYDMFIRFAGLVDSWGTEWKPVAEKIRTKIAPNVTEKIVNLMKLDETKFSVLCHGDCWVNNMLFKYGLDAKTPISVKFIDFQVSFFNSPAFDLKYFLASSTNLEVRRNSIPELLKIYHETLLKQLELYSYEGPIITFDSLKEEMERIELFGISTSLSILPIVLLENTQSIPDMEELIKDLVKNNSSNVMESWTEFYKPSPMYCEIMKETVSESIKTNPLLN
ncbi:uncharacterized protein [Rhodnius prolixus]|uniref:CHK kinase-like domain-containing protein n=1 Tax=Rhodnius prolixus TaxID=13249 RepID=T1HCW9_RHOPR